MPYTLVRISRGEEEQDIWRGRTIESVCLNESRGQEHWPVYKHEAVWLSWHGLWIFYIISLPLWLWQSRVFPKFYVDMFYRLESRWMFCLRCQYRSIRCFKCSSRIDIGACDMLVKQTFCFYFVFCCSCDGVLLGVDSKHFSK